VARRGEASARPGSGGAGAGAARGLPQGGSGAGRCTAYGRVRAAAARGRGTEEREREVDEGGPSCKLQKVQGPYCNAQITFELELKSVGFFKIYNFALRLIHKKAKDLKLI
jgi:hypothetical protein